MIWTAILLTAAGCFGLKAAGWAVPRDLMSRPLVANGVTLLPVALLAALVVLQSVGSGHAIVLDARLAGLTTGALCLWRKLPFPVLLVLAASATAAARAL